MKIPEAGRKPMIVLKIEDRLYIYVYLLLFEEKAGWNVGKRTGYGNPTDWPN